MKLKKVLFIIAICFSSFSFSQEEGDFSTFFGVSYQLVDNSDMGINAGFEYIFAGNTAFAPSFSYYFSPKGVTTYTANFDIRYYLTYGEKVKYYGIGGFNYLTVKIGGVTDSNIGVNAGGGIIYELNEKIGILGQLKYDTAGAGSLEPMIGVTYKF